MVIMKQNALKDAINDRCIKVFVSHEIQILFLNISHPAPNSLQFI